MSRLFAISDVHIEGPEDPFYPVLLQWIRTQPASGDILVLGGDIFNLFVGNKKVYRERFKLFLEEVQATARRGIKIHYLEGNHDFLMKGVFAGVPGVTLHESSLELEISGKKFFIAHGDQVDKKDYGYRLLRWGWRCLAMRSAIAVAPGNWIETVGKKAKAMHTHLPGADLLQKIRKTYFEFAEKKFNEGFDFVIMGHCHDDHEYSSTANGRVKKYMNVGYPKTHRAYLFFDAKSQAGLKKINF